MENTDNEVVEKEEIADTAEDAKITIEDQPEAESEKKSKYPTQLNLTIRAIVGGYVLYLAYQLVTSKDELTTLMWGAVAVFVLAGTALIILTVKHFVCGEYEGGKKDV